MDPSGFETIVTTHHGEIYRYLLRTTGRPVDADDLSQETFLRAYRAYRTRPPETNARAWLFTIATNVTRNHFRAQKRRRATYAAVAAAMTEVDGTGPEDASVGQEVVTTLEAVIRRLPLKQRLAFVQRKVHELDYVAIGQSLSCSAESARAHVFQALRKIRRALNGHERRSGERNR